MIVADRKKVPEIRDMVVNHRRVLLVGCGTCVTVCLAGGEREVGILGSALRMALRLQGRGDITVDECTIERQCEDAFIDVLASVSATTTPSARWAAGPACRHWPNGFPRCLCTRASTRSSWASSSPRESGRRSARAAEMPARRLRGDLSDHPLRQAHAQRSVRRLAGGEVRG